MKSAVVLVAVIVCIAAQRYTPPPFSDYKNVKVFCSTAGALQGVNAFTALYSAHEDEYLLPEGLRVEAIDDETAVRISVDGTNWTLVFKCKSSDERMRGGTAYGSMGEFFRYLDGCAKCFA